MRALVAADRDAAVEGVDQRARSRRIREHRVGVEEAVDRAALAADDEVDGAAVERRGRGHVRGRGLRRQRLPRVGRGAVEVVDDGAGAAVAAPAGRGAVGREHAEAVAGLVVDERLAEIVAERRLRLVGLAHERRLLRAGEDRPGDRVVDEPFARHAVALVDDRQLVRAEAQAVDEAASAPSRRSNALVMSVPLRSTRRRFISPFGASTRTSASPPLTWSARLDSTSMSTPWPYAVGRDRHQADRRHRRERRSHPGPLLPVAVRRIYSRPASSRRKTPSSVCFPTACEPLPAVRTATARRRRRG